MYPTSDLSVLKRYTILLSIPTTHTKTAATTLNKTKKHLYIYMISPPTTKVRCSITQKKKKNLSSKDTLEKRFDDTSDKKHQIQNKKHLYIYMISPQTKVRCSIATKKKIFLQKIHSKNDWTIHPIKNIRYNLKKRK